jgi:hypothetical protein
LGWSIGSQAGSECKNITVRNCWIHGTGVHEGLSVNTSFLNVAVFDCGLGRKDQAVYGSGDNTQVVDCTFTRCSSIGSGRVTRDCVCGSPSLWWDLSHFDPRNLIDATQPGRHVSPWGPSGWTAHGMNGAEVIGNEFHAPCYYAVEMGGGIDGVRIDGNTFIDSDDAPQPQWIVGTAKNLSIGSQRFLRLSEAIA